jgi:YD repeat-containing protein
VTTLRHQMANGRGCAIPSPTHTRPKRCRGAWDDRALAMVVVVGRPLCLGIRLTHVYEVELGATLRAKARNHVVRHEAAVSARPLHGRHEPPATVALPWLAEADGPKADPSEARSWGPPLSRVARAHARRAFADDSASRLVERRARDGKRTRTAAKPRWCTVGVDGGLGARWPHALLC